MLLQRFGGAVMDAEARGYCFASIERSRRLPLLTHSKQDTTTLTSTGCMNLLRDFAFIVLFFVFLIIWLVLWLAVHVTGGFVHLFIILAVLFLILHFVRGRRTTV
jgi:Flp pilus assembly protein TadB